MGKGLPCAKRLSPLKGKDPFLSPHLPSTTAQGGRCWNLQMESLHTASTWLLSQSPNHKRWAVPIPSHMTGYSHSA